MASCDARPRGFSLVEMMIALVIGSVGVSVAAYVAQVAVRQSGRGAQFNQLAASTQIIARQLRTDLESAGFGSTGAVGAQVGSFASTLTPRGGWAAIPAVQGVNALDPATSVVGGVRPLAGTDALQVVVPNARRSARTTAVVADGSGRAALFAALDDAAPLASCQAGGLVYVSDHSGSTGAGRTQLLRSTDVLQFDVRVGSDVSCARMSTYWVDEAYNLRRADDAPAAGFGQLGGLRVALPDPDQIIAMGVVDFQVAYRTSTELPAGVVGAADQLWAYAGAGATLASGALDGSVAAWFEVRQVRFNLVFRTLRAVDDQGATDVSLATEDRTAADLNALLPAAGRSRAYRFARVTSSQSLTNLRFFDQAVPSGIAAEPY